MFELVALFQAKRLGEANGWSHSGGYVEEDMYVLLCDLVLPLVRFSRFHELALRFAPDRSLL
jgi:hypothetical protein